MTAPALRPAARYVDHAMGLPVSLALRGRHTDDAVARDAWRAVMRDLHAADRVFSTYRPDSTISRLARREITPADCPPEVGEVLELAAGAERASDGAFSVYRPGPHGARTLDPSGVVKGWAAQRAAAALRALEDTDYCLNTGGDILARSHDPDRPWRIGIENPHDTHRILALIPVHDGAVATSGAAHRGAHVVDARTGRPPVGIAQVTVVAPTLTCADIDATAACALGPDAAAWLDHRVGRTGLIVRSDGTTTTTGGTGREP